MKIPRLVRRRPAFRRRTSPPPAARKLLLASLASGVVLLVMLAIVFVPIGLRYEPLPPLPQIMFEFASGPSRVVVSAATLVRPLSAYNATYSWKTMTIGSINPLNDTQSATLGFDDADSDGNLSVGDAFRLTYNGTQVLRVWYLPANAIVGFWPSPR